MSCVVCLNGYICIHSSPVPKPTSQKARGLLMLKGVLSYVPLGSLQLMEVYSIFPASGEVIVPTSELFQNCLKNGQIMARPCPPTPEHGFVESRIVKSMEEIEVVRLETLAANPLAEVALVGLIKADWNAIWNPSMLTVGPGHDGATSGKNTISFPLSGINPIHESILEKAGMAPGSSPYVELVGEAINGKYGNAMSIVQLRGGPALESLSPDFIPEAVEVKKVISPKGEDLLKWASRIRDLEKGTVVYHPGGSLLDHYSVHCRENNVPLIRTFRPKVGSILSPTGALLPIDRVELLRGLYIADRLPMCSDKWPGGHLLTLLLLAVHNSSVLRGEFSYWLGIAAGIMLKLGTAAMRVEARHAQGMKVYYANKTDGYLFYGKRSLSFHRASLSRVSQLLHYGFGDPRKPGKTWSYGGRKWALCGAALVPIFNAVRDIAAGKGNPAELISALNIAVNQAHNGGWWLNKFVDHTAYSQVPTGSLEWTLPLSPLILALGQEREGIDAKEFKKWVGRVRDWPSTSIHLLKWKRLRIVPGQFGAIVEAKAVTVPEAIQIKIPITRTGLSRISEGTIRIDGGKILMKFPDIPDVILWDEKPLEAKEQVSAKA